MRKLLLEIFARITSRKNFPKIIVASATREEKVVVEEAPAEDEAAAEGSEPAKGEPAKKD